MFLNFHVQAIKNFLNALLNVFVVMGKSETIDLRKTVEKALKENSRSKTLLLPKKGFVLSFIESDDYFKALEDGVYEFKGGLTFDNDSKFAIVRKAVLRKVKKGYLLKGDFVVKDLKSSDEPLPAPLSATEEDIKREVVSEKEVLETKKVGGEEKPTVVKYEFKTGRQVLYDLDKEIIATGVEVEKKKGAYWVQSSKNGKVPGVIMAWRGPGSKPELIAKTRFRGEKIFFDIKHGVIATGVEINVFAKGSYDYEICGSDYAGIPSGLVINGKTVIKDSYFPYWVNKLQDGVWLIENRYFDVDYKAVVYLDNDTEISGSDVGVLGRDSYRVACFSYHNEPVKVVINGDLVFFDGDRSKYKVFKQGNIWVVKEFYHPKNV